MTGPLAARIEAVLDAIEARNPVINAYTHVLAERARAEAGALGARGADAPPGPLAGMPYAVKNLFDVAGLPTLAGSKINAGEPPAAADYSYPPVVPYSPDDCSNCPESSIPAK